ncbi:MAG: hypothetical protein HY698_11225 [Deltaproteobacteria bacterium]|nr:hypothetical protein [Deltaproteobacteria bacterium]
MKGLINESHFDLAERLFPGIGSFYGSLQCKPMTFLELVWKYQDAVERSFSHQDPNGQVEPLLQGLAK